MSGESSIAVDISIEVVSVDGEDDVLDEIVRLVEASGLVEAVAVTIHGRWVEIASESLGHTREAYVGAIAQPVSEGGEITLGLGDSPPPWPAGLASWLENGLDTADVKIMQFAKGARHGKNGLYKVIPFEHAEPGRGSPSAPAMGSAYRGSLGAQRAGRIGRKVAQAARSLGPGERTGPGLAPKLKQTHATDLYAGMEAKAGGGAGGPRYFTFRTLTERSSGWGIAPRDFITKTTEDMETLLPEVIRGVISEALGGLGEVG